MPRPDLAGIHHVKIPVTDLRRSVEWYERVFDLKVTLEFEDDDGVVRGVGGDVPGMGATGLALRVNPKAAAGCQGFDPISFGATGQAEVEAWAAHLDELGIERSPVIEATIGWILVFHDPDGLEIHIYSWAGHGIDHSHRPGYGRPVRVRPGSD